MNRKVLNITIGVLITAFFTSCLSSNDEPYIPTLKEEIAGLAAFLESLEDGGHDIDTTELGVYYVVLEDGEGDYPQVGDSLEVGYSGYFTDGTLFDASDMYKENGTYSFVYGNPPMLSGWDSGMEVINKNAKVQLIIPSQLAYGEKGQGIIPPFTTLVFVIKMIDIKPSN